MVIRILILLQHQLIQHLQLRAPIFPILHYSPIVPRIKGQGEVKLGELNYLTPFTIRKISY